jgi:NitT/TauT family transport system ATP-binding protein
MSSTATSHEVLLQASEIVFSYPAVADQRPFELRVSDLAVRASEVLALCGPSGSGKSTLVAILAGLLRPRSGEVWLSFHDGPIELYGCSAGQWRRLRRHFGFVHQDPREYLNDLRKVVDIVADPLHIHKLPGYPIDSSTMATRFPFLTGLRSRRERESRALVALQKVGITRVQAGRSPSTLSGGQRQRVAIARALANDPKLLLMDEPFGALDEITRDRLNVELLRVWENTGATILFVTHSIYEAAFLGQQVLLMAARPGRVREIVDVPLPTPRGVEQRETREFVELTNHLRRVLETC